VPGPPPAAQHFGDRDPVPAPGPDDGPAPNAGPGEPAPGAPVQQQPQQPPLKAKCKCASLDVDIKSVEYVDHSLAVLIVGAKSREAWVKRYRVTFAWTLTCTKGDPNDCKGTLDFGAPTFTPAVASSATTRTVHCNSKTRCRGNTGTVSSTLSIPVDYIKDAGGNFTVDFPVAIECQGQTSKTLEIVFANGKVDRFNSDFDGDGKPDKKTK
jgi:hypothetical protein